MDIAALDGFYIQYIIPILLHNPYNSINPFFGQEYYRYGLHFWLSYRSSSTPQPP
jgi:hypothetical protein